MKQGIQCRLVASQQWRGRMDADSPLRMRLGASRTFDRVLGSVSAAKATTHNNSSAEHGRQSTTHIECTARVSGACDAVDVSGTLDWQSQLTVI